jgi:hypothetical protein
MLQAKKDNLPEVEWELLVKRTIHNVSLNPIEYLGHDLPANTLVADILSAIEDDFLKDVKTFR